jgi:hypothetical protein
LVHVRHLIEEVEVRSKLQAVLAAAGLGLTRGLGIDPARREFQSLEFRNLIHYGRKAAGGKSMEAREVGKVHRNLRKAAEGSRSWRDAAGGLFARSPRGRIEYGYLGLGDEHRCQLAH